ncbi:hypothetical protein HELRODRAFT_159102 [Helobdella robusta]|uniref:Apple domain-containing protein n=1 Tax=Helobdella robusta TaxID=6412 RepID=T1ENL3_HELRO|nr:hypothetical protein HELRODRAFT_159102 [Helobdella robusta]ESO12544.1 hypothetical protein HELRODRAFT_159102 [Helobdella robusta]
MRSAIAIIFFYINLNVIIAKSNCFQRFKEDGASFCSCDRPSDNFTLSTFSCWGALMFCSMACLKAPDCLAYNFWNATNQCQLFNQTLKKYSILSGCQHYIKKSPSRINTILTISVDNALIGFYVNGKNISVALNFPHANDVTTADTYNLSATQLHVLAVLARNDGGPNGLIIGSSDDYVQSNSSWKCTPNAYKDWYKINYNDSSWPAASVVLPPIIAAIVTGMAKWISGLSNCSVCAADFYCRKNFIANLNRLISLILNYYTSDIMRQVVKLGKQMSIANDFQYRPTLKTLLISLLLSTSFKAG